VLAIRPSGGEGVLHPSQPSDELGEDKVKGENMGAIKRDLEELTVIKADEIAEQRYGMPFSDLPRLQQHDVWFEAESIVKDKLADQADFIYDQMRERGHK